MKKLFKGIFVGILAFVYKTGLKFFRGRGLQRVWPLGQIYRFISTKLRAHEWPESFLINGHIVYPLPSQRAAFAIYGDREKLEFALFEREIPRGGTVLDVGANIGHYTLAFAKAVGPQGKVFAFEPEPANLDLLKKNIEANKYGNVQIIPAAVGDHNGEIEFFLSGSNPGGHQVWDMQKKISSLPEGDGRKLLAEREKRRAMKVRLVALDDFLKDYTKPINFIKMDVEGAEGGVLAGMKNILENNPDLKFHFEFIPSIMRLFGTDPRKFLETFAGYGFRFYSLRSYKEIINRLEEKTVDEILVSCSGNKSDEIFARRPR